MSEGIVEFYFDFLSPYSYLAYRILRTRLRVKLLKLKPVSLPHLIKLSGNVPPASLKPRAAYLMKDLQRSIEFYGFESDFKVPAKFPFDTRKEMYELIRMIEVEQKSEEEIDDFVMRTWKRIFHEGIIEESSKEPSSPIDEHLKSLLMKNTKEALDLGAYGVPFWKITNAAGRSETFFGSDRFHHIEAFLSKSKL